MRETLDLIRMMPRYSVKVCSLPGIFGPKSESNVMGQLARRTTYLVKRLRQIGSGDILVSLGSAPSWL
jgi:hypothetical protein